MPDKRPTLTGMTREEVQAHREAAAKAATEERPADWDARLAAWRLLYDFSQTKSFWLLVVVLGIAFLVTLAALSGELVTIVELLIGAWKGTA